MEFIVGQERARVTEADLLGEGGEARVYRWRDLALKVFHKPDAAKQQKVEALVAGVTLPTCVVAPIELVRRNTSFAGYAMRRIDSAVEVAALSNRRYRESTFPSARVTELFGALAAGLTQLHAAGVIAGDLNDGNVLARGAEPFLIDADSMQLFGLPCPVAHERFLDPRLYGVDLAARPAFDEGSDWYAFAVMLFNSLLYVHPFGGVHTSLPTPQRRAEARHSLYRPDVKWPRTALHHRVLPDDANDWFLRVFEKDERSAAPSQVLQLEWTCCACGATHARRVCPECQAAGKVRLEVLRHQGRCSSRTVFHTEGQVVAAALRGGLRYVYREKGQLRREGGEALGIDAPPSARVIPAGHATWIAQHDGVLLKLEAGRVVERSSTSTGPFGPTFTASSSAAWREEGGWLIDLHTGARIGQVLEGQTRLWSGDKLGLGFYRAGGFTSAFLLRPGRPGLFAIDLEPIDGRLVEAHCVFDDAHALLSLTTEKHGRETGSMVLFGIDGKRLAWANGPASDRMFQAPRSRALMGGRVVTACDGGLLSLSVDQGRLVEGRLFVDAQGMVGAGDELIAQPDGSLFVVSVNEISQLNLQ
ncbi:MAG: hypothetical protein QM723_15505 [Myxococcaceae bacterium]